MRISDWSSDVCSSDLVFELPLDADEQQDAMGVHTSDLLQALADVGTVHLAPSAQGATAGVRGAGRLYWSRDRKSAVEGQSVSVRGELGGRRISTKKTQIKTYDSHNHVQTNKQP